MIEIYNNYIYQSVHLDHPGVNILIFVSFCKSEQVPEKILRNSIFPKGKIILPRPSHVHVLTLAESETQCLRKLVTSSFSLQHTFRRFLEIYFGVSHPNKFSCLRSLSFPIFISIRFCKSLSLDSSISSSPVLPNV